jgi:hypothetical protein
MATARKIRDAEEARRCLDEVADSQLERAEWARRNGVNARSLNAWRLILQREEARQVPARWVELMAAQPAPTARYVVRVGDLAVEVGDDFQDHTLRRLLAVVASC